MCVCVCVQAPYLGEWLIEYCHQYWHPGEQQGGHQITHLTHTHTHTHTHTKAVFATHTFVRWFVLPSWRKVDALDMLP